MRRRRRPPSITCRAPPGRLDHQHGVPADGGARFRLKVSYRIASSLRADTKNVLQAMKTYGLVLADNGSPWYFQGTADSRWPSGLLDH